jgi:hypothetical protein
MAMGENDRRSINVRSVDGKRVTYGMDFAEDRTEMKREGRQRYVPRASHCGYHAGRRSSIELY